MAIEKQGDENQEKEKLTKKPKAKHALEALQAELDDKQNQLLMLAAEYDNFRKRSAKEKQTAYANAKTSVLTDFLPVLDNLERAISGDESDGKAYKKGVEMTCEQFINVLANLGVESVGAVGDTFDPNFHNAVMHVEDESYGTAEIIEVLQKGYKLGDAVLRAAMVKVAN